MELEEKVPKAIIKTVRYIKQDAKIEQLETIQRLVIEAIDRRKQLLRKT
jgi:hypothetical protein